MSTEKKKHPSVIPFFPLPLSLSLQFSERKRPKVKVISRSRRAGQRLSPGAQHDVSQHGERTDGVVSAATRAACRNRPACTVRTASQGGSGQQLVRLGAAGLPVPGDVWTAAQPHRAPPPPSLVLARAAVHFLRHQHHHHNRDYLVAVVCARTSTSTLVHPQFRLSPGAQLITNEEEAKNEMRTWRFCRGGTKGGKRTNQRPQLSRPEIIEYLSLRWRINVQSVRQELWPELSNRHGVHVRFTVTGTTERPRPKYLDMF